MKRIISVVLAVLILVSTLAGCASGTGSSSSATPSSTEAPGSASSESSSANNFDEKLTISINIVDTDKNNIDARYDFLREKFNVEFDLISCSLNDVQEKARIWVAGGDMPEVMWTDFSLGNFGELRSWIKDGMFKELPDMSKYPNYNKLLEQVESRNFLQVDGKDYFLFSQRDSVAMDYMSYERFMYRRDWAKAVGLYKEGDIYTWDEMMAMAKAFQEQDPGKNGPGKTIGIVGVGWGYPAFAGMQQMSPDWDKFVQKDGTYVWGGSQPETIEAVKMVKKMHEDGIVWDEHALAKTMDGPSKFQAGLAGILYHNFNPNNVVSTIQGVKSSVPDFNPEESLAIMNVQSPDGSYYQKETNDYYGTIAFRYDIDDKKMERFLQILDYLASDEGRLLQMYGLEGVDYTIKDGNVTSLWEKDEQGNFISPYPVNSDRILSLARLCEYEKMFAVTASSSTRYIADQIVNYNKLTPATISVEDKKQIAFSAPNKDKYAIGSETRDKILELVISSKDIEKDYKDWISSMQPKIDSILKELNEGIK